MGQEQGSRLKRAETNGGGGDCPCEYVEHTVHEAESFVLPVPAADVGKIFILVTGAGATITFPDISTFPDRRIEIYVMCTFTGAISLVPHASDSIGNNGIGATVGGPVGPGVGGFLWIGSAAYWGMSTAGGGPGGSVVFYAIFTSVASQQAYTVAALAGKATADILNIIIGQTVISSGDYGLSGTTLTFAEPNPMPGTKRIVVYFK